MDERFTTYAPERDIYQLLQVDPRADTETIVAACRRLARHYHPDYNDSPRATEEMQIVNSVRAVMTDPAARARYDRARERWLQSQARARWPAARPARAVRDVAPAPRAERQPRATRAASRTSAEAVAPAGPSVVKPRPLRPRRDEPVRAIVKAPVADPWDRPPTVRERLDLTVAPRVRRFGITFRAIVAGVRAGLGGLAPLRCPRCRAVVGVDDAWCGACRLPLVETSPRAR